MRKTIRSGAAMATEKKSAPDLGRPVLVTTSYRGVFFGYADPAYKTGDTTIILHRGRCCVYWSADVKGFLGLAATGPSANCRVGPPAEIELRDLTSISDVTLEAVEKWETGPWS